jgi:ABC-type sugar transport system ATPase subunit
VRRDPEVLAAYLGTDLEEARERAMHRSAAAGAGPGDRLRRSQVLFGIDLDVRAGEIVGLLGPQWHGQDHAGAFDRDGPAASPAAASVTDGRALMTGLSPDRIARSGLALVPEGRQVFAEPQRARAPDSFRSAARGGRRTLDPARLFELFPRLAERRTNMGNQLSGGEQQMLAIGRALVTNPQPADPRRGHRGPRAAGARGDLARACASCARPARPSWSSTSTCTG